MSGSSAARRGRSIGWTKKRKLGETAEASRVDEHRDSAPNVEDFATFLEAHKKLRSDNAALQAQVSKNAPLLHKAHINEQTAARKLAAEVRQRIEATNEAHAAKTLVANLESDAHSLNEEVLLLLKEKQEWKDRVAALEDEKCALKTNADNAVCDREEPRAMASRPAAGNTKPNGRVEAEDPDSRTDTTVTVAVAKVTELRLENRALQARINDYQDGAIVSWTYTVRLEEEKEKLETQVEKLEADFKTAVETLCRFKKRVRALGNESQGDLVWRPERLWTSGLEDGRGGFAIGRDEWVYGVGIPMCSLLACVSRRTRQYVCGDGRVSIR